MKPPTHTDFVRCGGMWHQPETLVVILHDAPRHHLILPLLHALPNMLKQQSHEIVLSASCVGDPYPARTQAPSIHALTSVDTHMPMRSPRHRQGTPYELSLFLSFMPKLTGSVVHFVLSELDLL